MLIIRSWQVPRVTYWRTRSCWTHWTRQNRAVLQLKTRWASQSHSNSLWTRRETPTYHWRKTAVNCTLLSQTCVRSTTCTGLVWLLSLNSSRGHFTVNRSVRFVFIIIFFAVIVEYLRKFEKSAWFYMRKVTELCFYLK